MTFYLRNPIFSYLKENKPKTITIMTFFKHGDDRINVEMVVWYTSAGKECIKIYLHGGYELRWSIDSKKERDEVFEKLDIKTSLSKKE